MNQDDEEKERIIINTLYLLVETNIFLRIKNIIN